MRSFALVQLLHELRGIVDNPQHGLSGNSRQTLGLFIKEIQQRLLASLCEESSILVAMFGIFGHNRPRIFTPATSLFLMNRWLMSMNPVTARQKQQTPKKLTATGCLMTT